MIKGAKFYVVFQEGEDEQYYNQYESLADAVQGNEAPVEVYECTPKRLGHFEAVPQPVKLKKVKGVK